VGESPPRAPLAGRVFRCGDAHEVERRLLGRRSVVPAISTTSLGWSGTLAAAVGHGQAHCWVLRDQACLKLSRTVEPTNCPGAPWQAWTPPRARPHVENYTVDASIFVATSY
jgi:hypothetical protein